MNPSLALPRPAAWRLDLLIAAAAGLLLVAWDASALDLPTTRWFADAQGFPWREHWLTRDALHDGGRRLAWGALALLVLNAWRPWWPGLSRRRALHTLAITLACLLAVPALKQLSLTSCPWDLHEFGGAAHWVSHWAWLQHDGGPGRCFPSGHAVSAFAFFSGYFMLRDEHPRAARIWLAAVALAGAAFGWAQLARGAHYASHTMWSAWLCWTMCAVGTALAERFAPARA